MKNRNTLYIIGIPFVIAYCNYLDTYLLGLPAFAGLGAIWIGSILKAIHGAMAN